MVALKVRDNDGSTHTLPQLLRNAVFTLSLLSLPKQD